LYFDICALSYNLFALMRQLLLVEFVNKRAKYVRHCLYAVAAKVVLHGGLGVRGGVMICLSKFCLTLGG